MAYINTHVEELEALWDNLKWDRKFEFSTPSDDILYVFGATEEEVAEAQKILSQLQEEEELDDGDFVIRSAHFGHWSSGEKIVICESIQDE